MQLLNLVSLFESEVESLGLQELFARARGWQDTLSAANYEALFNVKRDRLRCFEKEIGVQEDELEDLYQQESVRNPRQ